MAQPMRITPAQRAANFNSTTRQHIQTMGAKKAEADTTVTFEVPRARLLQMIYLYVEGEITAASEVKLQDLKPFALFDLIRRVGINYNDGFHPIVSSGSALAAINSLYPRGEKFAGFTPSQPWSAYTNAPAQNLAWGVGCTEADTADATDANYGTFQASTKTKFFMELPIMIALNERDPYGLILAQNNQTVIELNLDITNPDKILGTTGSTLDSLTITPTCVTFSIPESQLAWPDFSTIKVISEVSYNMHAGQNIVELERGMMYRIMLFKFEDESGAPLGTDDITSNIELLLNTADTPYTIDPKSWKMLNKLHGYRLPRGYFALNLSNQGQSTGYTDARDYIDSAKITDLALRFTSAKGGKVTMIAEKLSRLLPDK